MLAREFYFRRKEWLKQVRNPFSAIAIKKQEPVLNTLHHSEYEADVELMTIDERKAEVADYRIEGALQTPLCLTRTVMLETCL